MSIEPAYPNAASDPRLTNVHDKYKTLRRQIDDADWQGRHVTNAQRNELTNLRQMVHDGKLYTPNF